MQHAGCGLGTFTDEDFSEELANEVGMRPPWRTHAFRDPLVSVRRDLAQLRHNPFLLPGTRVRGFVVDIETFDLEEVFIEEGARRGPDAGAGHAAGRARQQQEPGEHGRRSLPGMSCTDRVSGVIPPRTRTWSICVPSHLGERLGQVPTSPSPARSAASVVPSSRSGRPSGRACC